MAVPQIDVARARTFVLAHGKAVDVARLEGLFGRTAPDPAVVQALERLQNPDGGFPPGVAEGGFPLTGLEGGAAALTSEAEALRSEAEALRSEAEALRSEAGAPAGEAGAPVSGASSVAATCAVLAWLRDIPPLAGSPMASRAVSYLRRMQRVDGAWVQEAGAGPSPRLTAIAAYTLLVMDPDHADPIARAGRWLRDALADVGAGGAGVAAGPGTHAGAGPTGAVPGVHATTLAMASAVWRWVRVPGVPEPVWSQEPQAGLDLPASALCAVLTPLAELGLRAGDFARALLCLQALAEMQQEEGCWPAEDGRAVAATLDALRVFRAFGLA